MAVKAWPGATVVLACVMLIMTGTVVARVTGNLGGWTLDDRRHELMSRHLLIAPPTALTTSNGDALAAWGSDAGGPVRIVDFIYTRCQTVCSAAGSRFARLETQLGEDDGIELLSISFDPGHDGPEQLSRYARVNEARRPMWQVGVVAGDTRLTDLLLRTLSILAIPDGMGGFVHNAGLQVIDPTGHVVAIVDEDEPAAALAAARQWNIEHRIRRDH